MPAACDPGDSPGGARFDDFRLEIIGLAASNRANTDCGGECRDRLHAADFRTLLRGLLRRSMNTAFHDFVTVDMRGSKTALVARARADRISVSSLVRSAVARELGRAIESDVATRVESSPGRIDGAAPNVKLSIRFHAAEAERLAAGAEAAGLSHGAYLAGLIDAVPVLATAADRPNLLAAVVASTAELATLNRSLRHLSALLGRGEGEPTQSCRVMLDKLASEMRHHLETASSALKQLQPCRRGTVNQSARDVGAARDAAVRPLA